MPSTLSRWYSSWPVEAFWRRRTFALICGPVVFLCLFTTQSVTLASEIVFRTWSSKPVSPTPFSLAAPRTSRLAIHRPFASRSTSTHAVHAVSIRCSLHREPADGLFGDSGSGSGLVGFFLATGVGASGSTFGSTFTVCCDSTGFKSPRSRCCVFSSCFAPNCRLASAGAGAGSATKCSSVEGTSPSAPRGRSGRSGVTRGFAADMTRFFFEDSPPLFSCPSFDALVALDSNFRGSKSELAALRFAHASRSSSRRRCARSVPLPLPFASESDAAPFPFFPPSPRPVSPRRRSRSTSSFSALSFLRTIRCSNNSSATRPPNVLGAYCFISTWYRVMTSSAAWSGSAVPPFSDFAIFKKSAATLTRGNPRNRSAALWCVAAVFPKLPLPNRYPYVPYQVLPQATGFSNRNSTPYFCETSSTETSLAFKTVHSFSQI
mmetsp:Transcript_11814/g.39283  ORF Transcript_11814/g.39283 Transcript_11814/m.39283 type:complete len:434 (-) Transcript_11814:770-2071(-)